MAHRCLGLAGVIVLTSALVACQADSADDAGSGPAGQTASDATASPSEGPSTTAREQHCTPSSDIDVDIDVGEDATVTFGPINGVPATAADGEPLVVVGTVSSADCQPLAGATLTMYQTDGAGEYGPGHGTDEMLCCHLGGSVVTDSQGHFQVITVRPAHYRGEANPPPAHIHLEVRHPDAPTLNSEIVFSDDARLPANAASQGLIVTTPTGDQDGWHAVAEIVMETSGAQT